MGNARKEWWSAAELAAARLPGLPRTRVNCSLFITRAEGQSPDMVRPRSGKGGGREIHITALPSAAYKELRARRGRKRPEFYDWLEPITERSHALHFRERMKECERAPKAERATRFKLLFAEIVARYAALHDASPGDIATHFAECLSAGSSPFRPEELATQQGAPPIPASPYAPLYWKAAAAREEWRATHFIWAYEFAKIRQGTSIKMHHKPRQEIRALIMRYLDELECMWPAEAWCIFQEAARTQSHVSVECMVSLARAGYISGLPLTKSALRQRAARNGFRESVALGRGILPPKEDEILYQDTIIITVS